MSAGSVYLDAVLHPPRSLSDRGFKRLMMLIGAISFVASVGFWINGAWPVMGFFGIEVLALWVVFRITFRAQTARTYVRVTADGIDVRKVDARGRERRARFPAAFARVVLDPDARGARALRLAVSNRAYPIGEHLTAEERESLAQALKDAISRARRERYTDGDGI